MTTPCRSLAIHHHYSWKPDFQAKVVMEGRELEKKSYRTPRSNSSYTGVTMGTGGRGYGVNRPKGYPTYTKSSKKDKSTKLNPNWSAGLDKGGKEWRGVEAQLVGVSAKTAFGVTGKRFAILETAEDVRLEVYPRTEKEFDVFYDQAMGNGVFYYKITHRPRVKLNNLGLIQALCISTQGVKLSKKIVPTHSNVMNKKKDPTNNVEKLYPGPGGLVTKAGWESIVEKLHPKSSCTCCMNPFSIEDANDINWIDPTCAVCKDCNTDTALMYQLMYQQRM